MRQEIRNIYTINEHPNKELCFEWIRNNIHDLGQHHIEDLIESLKALAKYVNADLDYSISIVPDRGEFIKITNVERGLLKELYNKREDLPLTGICYDQDLIELLYKGDFELEYGAFGIIHKEGEYIYSDEGLLDICQANEYEFYESGEMV